MNFKNYEGGKEEYGFDLRVDAQNDVERQCVIITDAYGFFVPIPFKIWNQTVNEEYLPKMSRSNPYLDPKQTYYLSILEYCKNHSFLYIGLN